MFNDLVNFSFDLYDLDSNITLEVSTDNITIKFNDSGKREIVLWVKGGEVYPQLVHDFHSSHAMPIDVVIKILEITRNYIDTEIVPFDIRKMLEERSNEL